MLDRGELVECASGDVLLSDRQSHLSALVEQTGPAEAEHLRVLAHAHRSYRERNQKNENQIVEYSDNWRETDSLVSS